MEMESSEVLSSLSMDDCELRADCMPDAPVRNIAETCFIETVGYSSVNDTQPLNEGSTAKKQQISVQNFLSHCVVTLHEVNQS